MEISGKRKRKENENDGRYDTDEEEIEKFCEIVEKFRAPYNWFRAKISGLATVTKGDDRNKKRIVEDDSKRAEVWTPCFLVEDFEEEDVIKSFKSTPLRTSEAAAPTTAAEDGEEKEKANNEELNLRLSL